MPSYMFLHTFTHAVYACFLECPCFSFAALTSIHSSELSPLFPFVIPQPLPGLLQPLHSLITAPSTMNNQFLVDVLVSPIRIYRLVVKR